MEDMHYSNNEEGKEFSIDHQTPVSRPVGVILDNATIAEALKHLRGAEILQPLVDDFQQEIASTGNDLTSLFGDSRDISIFAALINRVIESQRTVDKANEIKNKLWHYLGGDDWKYKKDEADILELARKVVAVCKDKSTYTVRGEELTKIQTIFGGRVNDKVESLANIAEYFAEGPSKEDMLFNMEKETFKKQLLGIKGVGETSINCALILSRKEPDILPSGDSAVKKFFLASEHYTVEKNDKMILDESKIRTSLEPYRSVAALLIWRDLVKRSSHSMKSKKTPAKRKRKGANDDDDEDYGY